MGGQLNEMIATRAQNDELIQATKIAAKAAEDSAIAAKDSAGAAKKSADALVNAERAFPVVEAIKLIPFPNKVSVDITYKNYGKTAARLSVGMICILVNTTEWYLPFDISDFWDEGVEKPRYCTGSGYPNFIIPPGRDNPPFRGIEIREIRETIGRTESNNTLPTLTDADMAKFVFVFGGFNFRDVLDDTVLHKQRFCFLYRENEIIPTGASNCWQFFQENKKSD